MEGTNEAIVFALVRVLLGVLVGFIRRRPATQSERLATAELRQAEQERAHRETTNLQAGFLRLPVELRNQIYEHALSVNAFIRHNLYVRVSKRRQYYITNSFQRGETCYKKASFPALLQTCRKLRVEAKPIFFGRTTACFGERDLWNLDRRPHLELDTWLKPCQVHGEGVKETFLDVLEDDSIAYMGRIETYHVGNCTGAPPNNFLGGHPFFPISMGIDRKTGSLQKGYIGHPSFVHPMNGIERIPPGCCRDASRQQIVPLKRKIKAVGWLDKGHRLRRDDFVLLFGAPWWAWALRWWQSAERGYFDVLEWLGWASWNRYR